MTGVVIPEKDFLASDISEGRRQRYLFLKEKANSLEDFVRLS
jgi:hypothetical protein